jgi:hypothetical protein
MNPLRATALLLAIALFLGGSVGCAPRVSPASPATLKRLHQRAIPPPAKPLLNSGPAQLPFSVHLPDSPTILELPLISRFHLPAIPARINGISLPLILDTGAVNVPVLVEPRSANLAGMQPLKGVFLKGSGVGGSVRVAVGRFESIDLGNQTLFGPGFGGILLQSYTETLAGIPVRTIPLNILGLKVLHVFSFIAIDSPRNKVELGIHSPYQPAPGARSFSFEYRNDGLQVALRMENQIIHALLDTGCSSPLNFNQKDLKKIPPHSFSGSHAHSQKSMGIAGLETSQSGALREIQTGDIRIAPAAYDSTSSNTESLLGWGAFRKNRMVIDFEKKKVWIEPPFQ